MKLAVILFLLLFTITKPQPFQLFDEQTRTGDTTSTSLTPPSWLPDATTFWMSVLPDDTPLCTISIPGTHNTMASNDDPACQTQTWSLPAQLDAGIRFIDIRNRCVGNSFAIFHGVCDLKLDFADVLRDVRAFLADQVGEVIFMRVKEEFIPAQDSAPFQSIWDQYMTSFGDMFVDGCDGQILTLGQVRGRVIVFRDADFDGYGLKYDGALMQIQDVFHVFESENESPYGDESCSVEQKKQLVSDYFDRALDDELITLNYLSGTTGLRPLQLARVVNEFAYGLVHPARPTGIVAMDYPGEWLIYRIIRSNFKQ